MFGFKSLLYLGNYARSVQSQEQELKEVKACVDGDLHIHGPLHRLRVIKLGAEKENGEIAAIRSKVLKEVPIAVSEFSPTQCERAQNSTSHFARTNNINKQRSISDSDYYSKTRRFGIDALRVIDSDSAVHCENLTESLRVFSDTDQDNSPEFGLISLTSDAKEDTFASGSVFLGEKFTRLTRSLPIATPQLPSYRLDNPLVSQPKTLDRTSPLVSHIGTKSRRLSPLRESNVNLLQSAVLQEPTIIVRKRHRASSRVLHRGQPFNSIHQSIARESSPRSFVTAKSSFGENSSHSNVFLGQYRTPSTPELQYSHTTGINAAVRLKPRSVSLGSLKHLRPDRRSNLYIGVNNPNLFLPSKTCYFNSPVTVTYRYSRCKRPKMASMTPSVVFGPSNARFASLVGSTEIPRLDGEQSLSSSGAIGLRSLQTDLNRSNSSTAATNGSDDSSKDLSGCLAQVVPHDGRLSAQNRVNLEPAETETVTSAQNQRRDIPTSSVRNCLNPENHEVNIPTIHESSRFGFLFTKCSQVDCDFLFGPDVEYECWHPHVVRKAFNVDSIDTLKPAKPTEKIANNTRRMEKTEPVLKIVMGKRLAVDAKIDGKPEVKSEPKSCRPSNASPKTSNQSQCSISFVDDTNEKIATGSERRTTLIPPHLRGPDYTQKFEEDMLTLPMPPVDHVYPGARRLSYSTTSNSVAGDGTRVISVLSKKPTGFWAKTKGRFENFLGGCLGLCEKDEWD